jgi:hypothetical protein
LKDGKEIENGAHLSLHIVLHDAPEDDPAGLQLASEKASAVYASIQRMNCSEDGSRPFVASDSGIVSGKIPQGIYETTQAAGSCIHPLGRALQSLEQVVKVVDGIADVSHLSKSSCVFRQIFA